MFVAFFPPEMPQMSIIIIDPHLLEGEMQMLIHKTLGTCPGHSCKSVEWMELSSLLSIAELTASLLRGPIKA